MELLGKVSVNNFELFADISLWKFKIGIIQPKLEIDWIVNQFQDRKLENKDDYTVIEQKVMELETLFLKYPHQQLNIKLYEVKGDIKF